MISFPLFAVLRVAGPLVTLFVRTWKRASRRQYRRSEAGSDSECDGWRPPVDSFTNLLAKQTARTHPVIIADGVSSARSRPYLIFIMPSLGSPPPFCLSVSLFLSPLPAVTGHGSNTVPIFASPFRHHWFSGSTGARCPAIIDGAWCHVSVAACAIWIRDWNGISGLYKPCK